VPALAAAARRGFAAAMPNVNAWAGLPADRPLVMGIVNVTPDSFSDGGDALDPEAAMARGRAQFEAGADIVDLGGESTRPGAAPTPPEVEQARVLPVLRALAPLGAVSIDTRHAATMQAALAEGARIVNDVSGLAHDPQAAATVARAGCAVVLMHMRGTPESMAGLTGYTDVAAEVAAELAKSFARAQAAGVRRDNIALDPGIGFAKAHAQNLELLRGLDRIVALGAPVLVGVSRKGFLGTYGAAPGLAAPEAKARLPGSLAAGLFALSRGARILRVHDVAETVQAVRVWQALVHEGGAYVA
jgi:dihydropteroate synthase